MVGPEIHDFPLDDQLTVDFIHQMSWLLKYVVSRRRIFRKFLNCEVACSIPTGFNQYALLKSSENRMKQLSSAPKKHF